jgi:hypothetical protein
MNSNEEAKMFLSNCPDDKKFWCVNSAVFSSLEELENGLRSMDSETFNNHVNKEKNDFSTWIYDVIGDVNLAENLRKTKTVNAMRMTLKNHIAFLKKNAR